MLAGVCCILYTTALLRLMGSRCLVSRIFLLSFLTASLGRPICWNDLLFLLLICSICLKRLRGTAILRVGSYLNDLCAFVSLGSIVIL